MTDRQLDILDILNTKFYRFQCMVDELNGIETSKQMDSNLALIEVYNRKMQELKKEYFDIEKSK